MNDSSDYHYESSWVDINLYVIDWTILRPVYITTSFLSLSITLVGLLANALVFFVIARSSTMRNMVHNIYLANLSVTDFLYLAVHGMAAGIGYAKGAAEENVFAETHSVIIGVQLMTTAATCSALTALSCDRFFAIFLPLRAISSRTVRSALIINICVWIGSVVFTAVMVRIKDPFNNTTGWFAILLVFIYILPLLIITTSYVSIYVHAIKMKSLHWDSQQVRTNMHHLRLIACVVLSFGLCWGLWYVRKFLSIESTIRKTMDDEICRCVAELLTIINSALNPFLYAATNSKIAGEMRLLFGGRRDIQGSDATTCTRGQQKELKIGVASSTDGNDGVVGGNCEMERT